jgi:hypothetical protein
MWASPALPDGCGDRAISYSQSPDPLTAGSRVRPKIEHEKRRLRASSFNHRKEQSHGC